MARTERTGPGRRGNVNGMVPILDDPVPNPKRSGLLSLPVYIWGGGFGGLFGAAVRQSHGV